MISDSGADARRELAHKFFGELETWAKARPRWQQVALRLLATKTEFSQKDYEDVLKCLLKEIGLMPLEQSEPEALFEASHLRSRRDQEIRLLSISNIENVNRLETSGLRFNKDGLSIVFGENGSGKSGFTRILRKACRTRVERSTDLAILGNIYGQTRGPSSAQFKIFEDGKEFDIEWEYDALSDKRLSAISVFDTRSAQLYVDEGNRLLFLPFDLDLPFRLNDVLHKIEAELAPRVENVEALLEADKSPFSADSYTSSARQFYEALCGITTERDIDEACYFSPTQSEELAHSIHVLGAAPAIALNLRKAASCAITLLEKWLDCCDGLSLDKLNTFIQVRQHKNACQSARDTIVSSSQAESRLKIGTVLWQQLWTAADQYAKTCDPNHAFPRGPVASDGTEICPLCQQSSAPVAPRLSKFKALAEDKTESDLKEASSALEIFTSRIKNLQTEINASEQLLLEEIRMADADLADFTSLCFDRGTVVKTTWLTDHGKIDLPILFDELSARLTSFAEKCRQNACEIEAAQEQQKRNELSELVRELDDRRCLSLSVTAIKNRCKILHQREGLNRALQACRTTEVTRRANEWVEQYLTAEATRLFEIEIKRMDLEHLNIGLTRQSTAVATGYKNKFTGGIKSPRVSDVLSEGEQRALSLAAFFTETALERPAGTLVIDDPVSSLDRRRSQAVAIKIAAEAIKRQVIVFTHDLLFTEELAQAADSLGIEPAIQSIFSTRTSSGKVDPFGIPWKAQPVDKRVKVLLSNLASAKKVRDTSLSSYEMEVKNIYTKIREAYERFLEEILFIGIIVRYRSDIQTLKLRYVSVPDEIVTEVEDAFTKASLHSHDNSRAENISAPEPEEVENDLNALMCLVQKVKGLQKENEKRRKTAT